MADVLELPAVLETDLFAERVRMLYEYMPIALAGSLSSGSFAVYVFFDRLNAPLVWSWLAALTLLSVVVWVNYRAYRTSSRSIEAARLWLWRGWLTMGMHSLVAGLVGAVLFVPGSLNHQLMLMILLFAWVFGAAIGTASYVPAFVMAVVAYLVPYCLQLWLHADPLYNVLLIATALYILPMSGLYRRMNRLLMQSLSLQYQYAGLARDFKAQKDLAEQANNAKSQFLAAASHDLRQPLHALGLFVGELRARVKEPTAGALIEKIEQSVQSMAALFNSLLDISKLDAGVISPNAQWFPINRLLAELELEHYPLAEAKGLRFKVMPCRAWVYSDPVLLGSILRNFLSNAIRYTRAGGVLLGCRQRQAGLRIEVWDSGMGIPSESHTKIFDEFVQLNNPARDRKQGLGLGLSVVKRLARLLDAHIELVSRPGRGSKFSIELPPQITQSQAPVGPTGMDAACVNEPAQALSLRVLVIEDEPSVLDAMHTLLTGWGCQVLLARSVADSLELARALAEQQQSCPDVIIADYRLPGQQTGIDAIVAWRALFGVGIPALLVTGDIAPNDLARQVAAEIPILHKPVPADSLWRYLVNLKACQPTR